MKYKITTKDGRVYRARKVEVAMGFVHMEDWGGELRIPAGEVAEIRHPSEVLWERFNVFLAILFLIVFVVAVIVFSDYRW